MDNTICISGLVMGVICAFIGGNISSSKGRSYGEGFVVGLLLGIIGLIILATVSKNENAIAQAKLTDGTSKKCPYCAEIIKQEAIICRYCGKELPVVKSLALELQEISIDKKSNPSEITDDEIAKWQAGFSQMGWLEPIGQNTKSALDDSPDEHGISNQPLLCVTYADVKGSHITGLSIDQTNLFSSFTALIATPQKLVFVRPDKKLVKELEYRAVNKVDCSKNTNSVMYGIVSKFGDIVQVTVEYENGDDEKIVDAYFARITTIR